jgi:DNA-directed RNA polymerase specialized sigma24 family protein
MADEEDIVVTALSCFFEQHREGRFPELRDRDGLWPLLARITANKAVDQQRNALAEKRGAGKIVRSQAMSIGDSGPTEWPPTAIEEEINPEYLVMMNEECERLFNKLPDEELRLIALRRLEGYKNAEIAQELNVIDRTIERRLNLIRSIWQQEGVIVG